MLHIPSCLRDTKGNQFHSCDIARTFAASDAASRSASTSKMVQSLANIMLLESCLHSSALRSYASPTYLPSHNVDQSTTKAFSIDLGSHAFRTPSTMGYLLCFSTSRASSSGLEEQISLRFFNTMSASVRRWRRRW